MDHPREDCVSFVTYCRNCIERLGERVAVRFRPEGMSGDWMNTVVGASELEVGIQIPRFQFLEPGVVGGGGGGEQSPHREEGKSPTTHLA